MIRKSLIVIVTMVTMAMGVANAQQEAKTASMLLKGFLESVGKGDAGSSASFFADSAYIEAPYVVSLGLPSNIKGKKAIEATMGTVKQAAPNFHFKNIKVLLETPTEVVAEYESGATMANGRPYKQHYIGHLVSKDGKIVSIREFLNTVVFVEAFFPNGLKDLIGPKRK